MKELINLKESNDSMERINHLLGEMAKTSYTFKENGSKVIPMDIDAFEVMLKTLTRMVYDSKALAMVVEQKLNSNI